MAVVVVSRVLACVGALLVCGAFAARAAEPADVDAACTVTFSGTSTLHGFEGTAPLAHVALHHGPTGWNGDVLVAAGQLETGNATRDANMHALLDVAHHPTIRAALRDVDPAAVARSGRLALLLTIRDVTRPLEADVHGWQADDDRVVFDADVPVSLEAFALEAPTVLGLIRVGDLIRVHAHVVVTAPHPPA